MKIINKGTIEETKATLNISSYIRSPDTTETIVHSSWILVINSLDTYKWIIIGAGCIIMTLGMFAVIFIFCKKQGQSDHTMSINIAKNQNMEKFSPSAPKTTLAHIGTNPIEHPEPQTKPPSYDSLDPALLEKDPALFTPEEIDIYRRSMIAKVRRK